MKKIETFIKEMTLICNQLNALENEFSECYQDINGNTFDGQTACAIEIENLMLMMTHEVSNQIEFGIQDLNRLLKYIEFRTKYQKYTDEELSDIIDKRSHLKLEQKNKIIKEKKEDYIKDIALEWDLLFANKNYSEIKNNMSK